MDIPCCFLRCEDSSFRAVFHVSFRAPALDTGIRAMVQLDVGQQASALAGADFDRHHDWGVSIPERTCMEYAYRASEANVPAIGRGQISLPRPATHSIACLDF